MPALTVLVTLAASGVPNYIEPSQLFLSPVIMRTQKSTSSDYDRARTMAWWKDPALQSKPTNVVTVKTTTNTETQTANTAEPVPAPKVVQTATEPLASSDKSKFAPEGKSDPGQSSGSKHV